ncbi:peptidoglycan-binding protein [Lusitaniella coriacea]|uniref:peptidoglycan-binding protein n=1 Tax=Lusitaniella coriacea TaxID=1983105 RepID=UPI003CF59F5B
MRDRFPLLLLASLTLGLASGYPLALPTTQPLIAQAQSSEDLSQNDLKPGDRGKPVRVLQHLLKELGYFEGEIDGDYGESTQTAVTNFQTSVGLDANGISDPQTWEQIKAAHQEKGESAESDRDSTEAQKQPRRGSRKRLVWIGGGLLLVTGIVGSLLFMLLKAFDRSIGPQQPLAIDGADDDVENFNRDYGALLDSIDDPEIEESETPPVPKARDRGSKFLKATRSKLIKKEKPPAIPAAQNEPPPIPPAKTNKTKPKHKTQPQINESLALKPKERLPRVDGIEELIKDLQEPQLEKRRKAIWELAQRADSRAVQPLIGLLIDADSQQRGLILEALTRIGTRTLKPMNRALTIALQDENAQVRKNAIRDLTQMYDSIANLSKFLYLAADDPDPEVQETARWAIEQLNSIKTPNISGESQQDDNR